MKKQIFSLALAAVTLSTAPALLPGNAFAQAISVNGGAIQGTITDPSGAVVSGAQVSITSPETGYKKDITTDKSGFYSVGPLNPGNYTVTVTSSSFQALAVSLVVRTGTSTPGSFKLSVGSSSTEISVNAGDLQVNTDQIAVSDVITKQQIDALPINGRNFLDLAQIEPGVILQSGESFDPTKAGYSAISVGGVSGRTTRILLDGQDITDETVGTTIFNVSQGAIGEFQLNRSTQDVSGEVTSTGQVLVATNTGTNSIHGQLFYNFQDHRALFARLKDAQDPQFQRNQFGGSVGGPILRDKLFFFGNAERIKQDSSGVTAVNSSANAPFAAIAARYPLTPTPFRETYSTVRLDYNGPLGGHYFVRANYDVNSASSNAGLGYSLYANRDNTPGIAGGADFATGRFTHSFRGSYEKFHNLISDVTGSSASLYNPIQGYEIYNASQGLFTGPNYLAPQQTYQSDKQVRYDGSWTRGSHNIRYGYSLNHILGGGLAAFWGLAPMSTESQTTLLTGVVSARNPYGYGCNNVVGGPACSNDPINGYRTSTLYIGNGQGSFTENPGFGLPGSGVHDWRQAAYAADNWKVTPNFTVTAGLRWSVDTDRANQDLAPLPCSAVTSSVTAPCTGSAPLLAQWGSAFSGRVHQPFGNLGPQFGFNYAPGNHKTSLRAGIGMYFEGDVFNNTTNARSSLLASGPFYARNTLCSGTGVYTLSLPDGSGVSSVNGKTVKQLCYSSIASSAPTFLSLRKQYQTATQASPNVPNTGFVGNTLQVSGVYGSPYRTPYSEQWNAGIEREIFKNVTLKADYVHNATIHIAQQLDQNHVGAARYLNRTAALNAIASTASAYPACAAATTPQAQVACSIASGATINDFANNGLDSGNAYLGGYSATYKPYKLGSPDFGAAFAGLNPVLGNGDFIIPIGRSGYDALQVVLRQNTQRPVPGIETANLQISYALSRIVSSSGGGSDQFFSSGSYDNDDPNRFMGRNGLDRKHQVNFAGSMTLKYGPRVGLIGHFYSAAAQNLALDNSNAVGAIFSSDVTGDGTTGDIAPGTQVGDYMHRVKPNQLATYVTNFNSTLAGTLTPAGQALVSAGLFTPSQLSAIGANIRPIAQLPQATALKNPAFRSFDASLSYPFRLYRFHEGLSLEPAVVFYNVANLANYGGPGSGTLLNQDSAGGVVNTLPGYLTGPNNYSALDTARVQRGSGTFDVGAPRSAEFQLKLNF